MAEAVDIPIIASGGVSSLTDILCIASLEPLGVTGVIVGKALYSGKLSLPEAVKAVGNSRIQDLPPIPLLLPDYSFYRGITVIQCLYLGSLFSVIAVNFSLSVMVILLSGGSV